MDGLTGAKSLLQDEEEEEFLEQLQVIDRMARDEDFKTQVVAHFNHLKFGTPLP